MTDFYLQGKRALISGSTQGIGLAAATRLASLGASCTLLARNEEKLKAAVQSLPTTAGQMHIYYLADFSKPEEVLKAINEMTTSSGGAHILVNNTGGPPAGPIASASTQAFLDAFNQHLICNHILATSLLPFMKEAGYGRIINVISTSVKIPLKGLGVSNTIRAAVAAWAKTMANELASSGITVNNVLPGATATSRLEAIIENKSTKTGHAQAEVIKEMLAEIPAGRFAEASEIASLIGYLAGPDAGYITGTSIPVDGGRTGSF